MSNNSTERYAEAILRLAEWTLKNEISWSWVLSSQQLPPQIIRKLRLRKVVSGGMTITSMFSDAIVNSFTDPLPSYRIFIAHHQGRKLYLFKELSNSLLSSKPKSSHLIIQDIVVDNSNEDSFTEFPTLPELEDLYIAAEKQAMNKPSIDDFVNDILSATA